MDEEGFLFSYPLWVCVRSGETNVLLCAGDCQDGGRFVGVFTDEDLADRFLEKLQPAPPGETQRIAHPGEFLVFLGSVLNSGISHILFDPPSRGATTRTASTIGHLVGAIGQSYPSPE